MPVARKSKGAKIGEMFFHQKRRTKNLLKYTPPKYTLQEFRAWVLAQSEFHVLHAAWVKSGYEKALAPSCSRIDCYKPWDLDNVELVTWAENDKKSSSEIRNGINNKKSKKVYQFEMDGAYVRSYFSTKEAERLTGIGRPNIAAVCNGRRNHAGHFKWSRTRELLSSYN